MSEKLESQKPNKSLKEADALVQRGVPVYERLRISPNCALILPTHIALDQEEM